MPDTLSTETAAPTGPLAPNAAPLAPQPAAPAPIPSPFDDIIAGRIPAVSLAPVVGRQTDPAQEYAISNLDKLNDAGLEYHELKDHYSVLFNPAKISAAQLDAADKEKKLFAVAPLARQLGNVPVSRPAATPLAAPALAAPPAAPAAGGAPILAGASARVPLDRRLQTDRLHNFAPVPPGMPNPPGGLLARRAV